MSKPQMVYVVMFQDIILNVCKTMKSAQDKAMGFISISDGAVDKIERGKGDVTLHAWEEYSWHWTVDGKRHDARIMIKEKPLTD